MALRRMAPRVLSTSFASHAPVDPKRLQDDLGSYDDIRVQDQVPKGDVNKRAFTYLMAGGVRFLYASAARLLVLRFVASLSASADVLALASLEVPLDAIDEGSTVTVKWYV